MQRLVNLAPEMNAGDHASMYGRTSSKANVMQMNLAALVVPGVISGVCVLVGLMTLHEYCVDSRGSRELPRCFFPSDEVHGTSSSEESRVLSYAKIAAISFYSASLLTTACVVAFPGAGKVGPLKTSLAFYHILICLWSTLYYSLDFAETVPLVRSERDGMLEYSAVRVLAVWPVTSTLMISKIAVLSTMTRKENKKLARSTPTASASDAEDAENDALATHGDDDDAIDSNAKIATDSRLDPFLRTFSRLRAARKRKESDELMSTSWDVWAISLVNNLMLLAGAFGLVADRWLVRVVSMAVSCTLFVVIMRGFRVLFTQVISRVQHPEDRLSLRALELTTYATWTLFPIIQLLREFRLINTSTQFMLMTAADIVAKMTYSTMLVFSNFWLINAADGLMRLDERLFTDALEVSRTSQLAARTLEKAKIEAESVSQLHRAFVANISHELRTPLNSIIAFNSLLLEDESLTEAQREFVGSAIVSAEALLGIIGQILDFAKLESGSETHQAIVLESFDVDEMMNELVDIVGQQANRNRIEMVVDVDPALCGLVVRGDKFRLRQALINVTNNSVKYTREGGEVRVSIERIQAETVVTRASERPETVPENARDRRGDGRAPRSEDGGSWLALGGAAAPERATESGFCVRDAYAARGVRDLRRRGSARRDESSGFAGSPSPPSPATEWLWIRLEVADTGIGIAEDKLGVVFKPFGQASTSSTREYGGTGLGLAITKSIISALGGHISCASAVGRGTTMTLDVPLELPRESRVISRRMASAAFRLPRVEEVVTVVEKRSLGDAIGRVANAGHAAHSHLDVAARFPHTETQRRVWGKEVAAALRRVPSLRRGACVAVLEEAFLAPLFAEWHRSGALRSRADVPVIVLVVAKKITARDPREPAGEDSAGTEVREGRGAGRRLRSLRARASVPAAAPTPSDDGSLFASDASEGPFERDHELDEAWRALLRGAQQVIRPVKPSALRDALRAADAELARRREGGGFASRGGDAPAPAAPAPGAPRARAGVSRLAHHSVVDGSTTLDECLPEAPRAAAARRQRTAAATVPRRVTRSATRRASVAEISEITEEEDPATRAGFAGREEGIVADASPSASMRAPAMRVNGHAAAANGAGSALAVPECGCVLIVEDNLMNQKVAKVVVKRCGLRADVANNGREAVEALTRGGRYDAILMDIQMPVMDGLDATREIRRLEALGAISPGPGGGGNFIVAVSANATAENHQEGFEAGMDEYITKPIYPTRLRELLMTPRRRGEGR